MSSNGSPCLHGCWTPYTRVDVRTNDICTCAKYTQLLFVTPFAHTLVTSAFPACGWRKNHASASSLKQKMKRHSVIFYESYLMPSRLGKYFHFGTGMALRDEDTDASVVH